MSNVRSELGISRAQVARWAKVSQQTVVSFDAAPKLSSAHRRVRLVYKALEGLQLHVNTMLAAEKATANDDLRWVEVRRNGVWGREGGPFLTASDALEALEAMMADNPLIDARVFLERAQ